jgi:hypothetical protein
MSISSERYAVPVSDVGAFDRATELLDPSPHPLETGVARCTSGVVSVAARTDMPGCSGAAFEWWFRFACDTDQYKWWHPLDHVSSRWVETSATTHIGSTHLVDERLGETDPTVHTLQIHFVDPVELFGEAYTAALEAGDVSGCVAAQIGIGDDGLRDDRGRPNMGRMAHICRDTRDGMVLRSRFWLGQGAGLPAEALRETIPDALGLDLMQHAHTEFKFLSRVLPPLYDGAHPEGVELPW